MARLIERVVKKPLSESLLFGTLADGGVVRLVVENDTIALEQEAAPPPVSTPTEPVPEPSSAPSSADA
jgi:ATP-dependent Clp protease ATP-binding subunit ClpA